ncbi:cytochrome P450 [Massilia sp. R2A-15]|uniref:cytochrome P450 n=1 Tax=Massilia sp. R2A-15 TaxID=3064278 RepID=UPI002734493A|nr:cytochrome P450 [Massilia sp. R2A-15]WLI89312.1 cytochrome P450 [Massilia sp. R2A-15]
MKPLTSTRCPFHVAQDETPRLHPPGSWPPGPPSGITGWGLLRRMSGDLLGTFDEWRRQYGDLVHLRIWPEHQIVVTDPQLVRELLVNHHDALIRWERGIEVFSQLHGNSVLTAEGELWQARRHALQPSFSPKGVQPLVPVIAAAAARTFSQWRAGDEDWPIETAFTSLGMDIILRIVFSSEADADARLAERAVHDTAVAANAEMYWPASWPDWMPWKRAKREGLRVLDRLIVRHIEARLALARDGWPQDVLSRLLALHLEDPAAWPLKAVRDECMTAFLAGHETAAASLTWWAWCMAANPSAQSAAQREVDAVLQGRAPTAQDLSALTYLTQTLHETLRLYPAAPVLLTRRCVRPITLGGWQLPARTMFTVPVQLMHHDARWFPEPHAYRPERFSDGAPAIPRGAFMPLGTGPRVCLGQHLAMAEMTIVAAMFLQRFSVGVPAGMAAPKPVFNITLRPDQPLRLALARR